MTQDPNNLIWIDMEMSGLNPETDRILELAVLVTNSQLEVLAQSPVLVVHQAPAVLDAMDSWNQSTHRKSGLIERVQASQLTEAAAQSQMLAFISQFVPPSVSPMCGNSIHQDRRFLVKYMPQLEQYFLYRNLDVSTLKELVRRWKPTLLAGFTKHGKHEALADIHESIQELIYYREHVMKI
jgi:oligoribonuclease